MAAHAIVVPFPSELLQLQQDGSNVSTAPYETIHDQQNFALPISRAMVSDLENLVTVVKVSALPVDVKVALIAFNATITSLYAAGDSGAPALAPGAEHVQVMVVLARIEAELQYTRRLAQARDANNARLIAREPLIPVLCAPHAILPAGFDGVPFASSTVISRLPVRTIDAALRAYDLHIPTYTEPVAKARVIWQYIGGSSTINETDL